MLRVNGNFHLYSVGSSRLEISGFYPRQGQPLVSCIYAQASTCC